MKRILVANAPNRPFSDPSYLIEPIDVLTVASFVQSLNHEVVVRDFDREQYSVEEVLESVKSIRPDCIVLPFDYHIPLYTSDAIQVVTQILAKIEELGIKIILGGRPAKAYPEVFLAAAPSSVLILGEMELAIEDLLSLEAWNENSLESISGIVFKGSQGIRKTELRKKLLNLDRLPIADRKLLDVDDYIDVRTLLSSRGCVESCSFCPVHTFWGRWRYHSATRVVDEIQYLVEQTQAQKILFLDDHATVNKRRMQEICRLILERNIRCSFGCLSTPNAFDTNTVALMAEAGFRWIHYGCEFASDRVLKNLGKRSSVSDIRRAVTETKEHGIRVRTSWIFDLPETKENELEDTVSLIEELAPHEVRAHFLALRAGAPLAEESSKISRQYIHGSKPLGHPKSLPAEKVTSVVDRLTRNLAARDYLVVKNSSDWLQMNQPANSHKDVRFISFCPGRYGIGWQEAA